MIFRNCAQGEQKDVLALYASAIGSEFCAWDDEYPTIREINHDFETGNLFVMEEGGRIISAASIVPENEMDDQPAWRVSDGKHAEIARVVVGKEYRGRGIAKETVAGVLNALKARGRTSARLSVIKGHMPALKTYLKLGFERVGEADMYGHSYDLLEKKLV